MGELGKQLREAREARGLSLEEAEAATRIRRDLLHALEDGRYEQLPGDVYARGFVRNYAAFLALDVSEALAAYHRERGPVPAQAARRRTAPPAVLDEPLTRRTRVQRVLLTLFWLLAVVVLALAVWYGLGRYRLLDDPLRVLRDALPVAEWLGRAAVPSDEPPLVDDERPAASPTATEAAPVGLATLTPTPEPTPEATPEPTATPTRAPTATPEPFEGLQVQTEITSATWLEVDIDGERVFAGTVGTGDDPAWQAERTAALRVGNAGGIRLIVNGVDQGVLGAPGQVLDVLYDLDELPAP